MSDPVAVVQQYFDALAAKDFATVAGFLAEEIVWHQPGANRFSGVQSGADAVNAMIGGMMEISEGSFELALTAPPMLNGDLVAAPIHFTAKRAGADLAQDGVDLLKVADGKIVEAWLFSADQPGEDAFWG
ncbi:nuclear transport factor 2 family protein [Streptomyces sp. SID13031]|uniref:nuclear transport factor 2 family protein n=1 Tax=Streptomyces sp. SID13031 TaxID=2706046 RepID=UPI0013C6489A|nr:nuclear transport factor 2 family protein [Streptomyces sp. SID13031]NEA36949.1 nuclear transport factor 2 family protein [Streptomyces sp. SID13031]